MTTMTKKKYYPTYPQPFAKILHSGEFTLVYAPSLPGEPEGRRGFEESNEIFQEIGKSARLLGDQHRKGIDLILAQDDEKLGGAFLRRLENERVKTRIRRHPLYKRMGADIRREIGEALKYEIKKVYIVTLKRASGNNGTHVSNEAMHENFPLK